MRAVSFLTVVFFAACAAETEPKAPEAAPAKVEGGRFIILGFDGVDPRRVDTLVKASRLPNLAALGAKGHRGLLRSTNPPQSPVAWSAFATGLPAGEHGIFDFVGRNPQTYFPEIATTRVVHAEVHGDELTPARADNLRRGPAFWDVIAKASIPARALRVPYNYPLPEDGARALSGLGTPDARGINSSFTLLTTDKARVGGAPPAGGQWAALEPLGDGAFRAMVEGPAIKVDGQRQKTYAPVVLRLEGERVGVELKGQKHALALGETSPYVNLEFSPGPALTVRAVTRLTVQRLRPDLEVYLEPLSMNAETPYLAVANPLTFGADLWRTFGAFKTVGWVDDTSALGAAAIDEDQFLREAKATLKLEAAMLRETLDAKQEKLVVAVFTSVNRIGHMFYRHIDPAHPARDAKPNPAWAGALDDAYEVMDGIVGDTVAQLAPDDTLVIMSDHGFASFRRGLNLNTWLQKNGFLKLKRGVKQARDFFADVDWAQTQAYALGTGNIYINTRGREAQGSVPAAEAANVARKIASGLLTVKDGQEKVVLAAYLGDDIYAGSSRATAPDVRVAMAEGYRASWATSLGGIPKELFEVNTKRWSGDHASSRPEDVPGIIISNKPLLVQDPGLEDFAATAYKLTGVAAPAGIVGRPLF